MLITSVSNPKVQRLQKLQQKKKLRQSEGVFIAEGVRLLEEAIKWKKTPQEFYWGGSLSLRGKKLVDTFSPQINIANELTESLVKKISDTGNSQGVFGVFEITKEMPGGRKFLLLADQIRDPGNLGTLMRSAKAMGVDGIIATPGTVDACSPKVVRSAMGVHFALPIVDLSWEEINTLYPKRKGEVSFWTTVVDGGVSILDADLHFPIALVIGGEANGVSDEALRRSNLKITIPMQSATESLNAGVAGSIALYEIMRKTVK